MQHIEEEREQDTDTDTNNPAENRTQDTTICSAHNFSTYNFDLYHEYAYIKNSNTIEIYTISKENIQKTLIFSLYSFDFYHLQQYIEKLYNTAIY